MSIFKEEFRKIASRRFVWISLGLLSLFLVIRLYAVVAGEYVVKIDAKTYKGIEAVRMDKKLAKEYEGPLTMEKVQDIKDRFGFYYYDEDADEYVGNFCNEFVTEQMTNFNQVMGTNPDEIEFMTGQDWENNAAPFLTGKVQFGYGYGWQDLAETYTMVVILLSFILIIAMAPVFAEEYTLRTAGLLFTTKHGKKKGIWMKIAAALSFGSISFTGLSILLAAIYLSVYGTDGLDASGMIVGNAPWQNYFGNTIGAYFLCRFVVTLIAILVLTVMCIAVSACCGSSFMAVVVSLIVFVIPFVVARIAGSGIVIVNYTITRIISHFIVSMPFCLLFSWDFRFKGNAMILHTVIAVAVGLASTMISYRAYRRYQG